MELLKLYKSINLKTIEDYVENSKEEDLHLEFKQINDPAFNNNDDKKNFAKVLSGFGNSDGGVVVWGVKAKKNKQNIDCAIELKPIISVSLLVSKLHDFTGDFVSPIIDKVQHKKIFSNGQNDEGFAVTIVPESISGPHMAKAREYRYYKRSGDSFYKMEHFDLEDMFGRRKKPRLKLSVYIKRGGSGGGMQFVDFLVCLKNVGKGLAKYLFLKLELNEPYKFSAYAHTVGEHGLHTQWELNRKNDHISLYGTDNEVIHPDCELQVIRIRHEYDLTEDIQDLKIMYKITAEGIALEAGENITKDVEIKKYL